MPRILTASLVLALLAGCSSPPSEEASPHHVGAAVCVECHAAETERWRGSHHDRAMQVAADETVLGDFDNVTFTKDGVTTTLSRAGDRFVVRTDGPDGALADYEVAYTFGVDPLQQYLVALPGGRLQALPIAWDARPAGSGGQRWFHLQGDERVPAGDPLHWTGPLQNWNFMCADCHSTELAKGYDEATGTYRTTYAEIDVSCEACHGPGSAHVAAARRGETGAAGLAVAFPPAAAARWTLAPGDSIAQPTGPLPGRAESEACALCHSRRAPIAGASVPGGPFLDLHLPRLLDAGLYEADGAPIDEVYVWGSFVQSRMHARGVTCSDCHDPHSLRLHAEGNALCARCHDAAHYDAPAHHRHAAGTPAAECTACHMPARTYMQVDDRHDHAFRVPRPDLAAELGTPDACTGCHRDRDAAWAADRVVEWYGPARTRGPEWARAIAAGRARTERAPDELAAAAADTSLPSIVRATALSLLRPWPARAAGTAFTLQRDPDPLVRASAVPLLDALPLRERLPLAVPALRDTVRAVRIAAARVLAGAAPGDPGVAASLASATAELAASLDANADRPEAHVQRAILSLAAADTAAAALHLRDALRLDPACVPARVNLADLDRGARPGIDGEAVLREGIALRPGAAALHHALGLRLARHGRTAAAEAALAEAARLAPGEPRFAYVHAVALHSSGRAAEAIASLERLHDRFPGDLDTLEALAAFHRDAGHADAAGRYARTLARLR